MAEYDHYHVYNTEIDKGAGAGAYDPRQMFGLICCPHWFVLGPDLIYEAVRDGAKTEANAPPSPTSASPIPCRPYLPLVRSSMATATRS
jgi:hypothetical protein